MDIIFIQEEIQLSQICPSIHIRKWIIKGYGKSWPVIGLKCHGIKVKDSRLKMVTLSLSAVRWYPNHPKKWIRRRKLYLESRIKKINPISWKWEVSILTRITRQKYPTCKELWYGLHQITKNNNAWFVNYLMYSRTYIPTCFMSFNIAWTLEGLDAVFCSSAFPLPNAKTGIKGDGMGVSSDEAASNFLELEIPCRLKEVMPVANKTARRNKSKVMIATNKKVSWKESPNPHTWYNNPYLKQLSEGGFPKTINRTSKSCYHTNINLQAV